MSLKVTFELEDKDLRISAQHEAGAELQRKLTEEEILTASRKMVTRCSAARCPCSCSSGWTAESLIDMVRDGVGPGGQERKNVMAALAYFADPQDMIPDNIPVLGFIDDAIMIELVVSELKHELDAFTTSAATAGRESPQPQPGSQPRRVPGHQAPGAARANAASPRAHAPALAAAAGPNRCSRACFSRSARTYPAVEAALAQRVAVSGIVQCAEQLPGVRQLSRAAG